MTTCAVCGNEVDDRDIYMSERGETCGSCTLDEEIALQEGVSLIHPAIIIGVIAAVIPFFISISQTTNGTYLDFVALAGGGLAGLAGLTFLVSLLKSKVGSVQHLAISAGVVFLGALHVIRGIGVI